MDGTGSKLVSPEIQLICDGLFWLSDNIEDRDNVEKGKDSRAVKYSNTEMRILHRIKDFVESEEDGLVILLRNLLEWELHQDILDVAVLAATIPGGKEGALKPIEEFTSYEQNLIFKLTFNVK